VEWEGKLGFEWGGGHAIRWGTNHVFQRDLDVRLSTNDSTISFSTDFSSVSPTEHECQVAVGDSGGGAFIKRGGTWELAGILFASNVYAGQPSKTALFGNETLISDISVYRSQILALTSAPACSDGLDDDADGRTDWPDDPGCDSPGDTSERSPALECDDGLDNDGDGAIDFPADEDCEAPDGASETPPCDAPEPLGDANFDGVVDGADYVIWADHFELEDVTPAEGDFNCDGNVDGADYVIWADNFGAGSTETGAACGLGFELTLVLAASWLARGAGGSRRS
jgi:hypothetical protein